MSEDRTPSLAIPGVVLSAFGWLTCGLFCIPGILLTIGSFFQRGPKVWSLVGLLVGLPGLAFFALFGFAMMLAAVGIGAGAKAMQENINATVAEIKEKEAIEAAKLPVDVYVSLPDDGIPPEPDYKRLPRVWTAGKFSVEASYKFKIGDKITIQRTDNGKEISVEVAKLSEEDQKWIEENLK